MKTVNLIRSISGSALLSLALSFSTQAANVTWTAVCAQQGPTRDGSAIPALRSNPTSAEVPQGVAANLGDFYSLGNKGYIILEASAPFGPQLTISEVTFGQPPCDNIYRERARIYFSQVGGNMGWVYAGTICHDDVVMIPTGWAKYVKIVDDSDPTPDPTPQPNDGVDFYDVDGVVAPEFIPNENVRCSATLQGKSWDGIANVHPARSIEANGRVLENLQASHLINSNLRDNANQMNFFSLGFGGEMCFEFSPVVIDEVGVPDIQLFETTWRRNGSNPNGCNNDYPEKAEIWISSDGVNYVLAGVQCKDYGSGSGLTNGRIDINGQLPFVRFMRVKDITDKAKHKKGADAFDVDGVLSLNQQPNTGPFPCEMAAPRRVVPGNLFETEMPVYEGGVPEDMEAMSIAGNPVVDQLNVRFILAEEGGVEFIVRDFTGREVLRQPYTGRIFENDEVALNISSLPRGNYVLTLQSASYKEVARFIKK